MFTAKRRQVDIDQLGVSHLLVQPGYSLFLAAVAILTAGVLESVKSAHQCAMTVCKHRGDTTGVCMTSEQERTSSQWPILVTKIEHPQCNAESLNLTPLRPFMCDRHPLKQIEKITAGSRPVFLNHPANWHGTDVFVRAALAQNTLCLTETNSDSHFAQHGEMMNQAATQCDNMK